MKFMFILTGMCYFWAIFHINLDSVVLQKTLKIKGGSIHVQ